MTTRLALTALSLLALSATASCTAETSGLAGPTVDTRDSAVAPSTDTAVSTTDSALDDSTVDTTGTDTSMLIDSVTEAALDTAIADTADTAPPPDVSCAPCPPLATCVSGSCTCPKNSSVCATECVDLAADPRRCNACAGGVCAVGSMCANGACACQPGLTLCTDICIDTKGHPDACGGCGAAFKCADGKRCRDGTCLTEGSSNCPPSRPDECDSSGGRRACFDTKRDPMHCGGCGIDKRCASSEFCVEGSCIKYAVGVGCTTCPCANCEGILKGSRCCPAPPGFAPGRVTCVDGAVCPAWLPP